MGRSRNLADLLDANGDVKASGLDNVPPSNDASALTTGTLSADRLGTGSIAAEKLAGSIPAAKLADTYLKPDGDGSGLSGLSSSSSKITVDLESGASVTAGAAVSLSSNGKVNVYPTLNTISNEIDNTALSYNVECPDGQTRVRGVVTNVSEQTRLTLYGQAINPTTLAVTESTTSTYIQANGGTGSAWQMPSNITPLGNNYYVCFAGNTRSDNSYGRADTHMCMIKVDPSTGAVTKTSEVSYDVNWSSQCFSYSNWGGFSKNHFYIGSSNQCASSNKTKFYYYNYSTDSFSTQNSLGSARNVAGTTSFLKNHVAADGTAIFYVTGNAYRKQPTANSGLGIQDNSWSDTTLQSDYSNDGKGFFPDSSHLIYYYKNADGVYSFVLYSIASNGDLTELDRYEVGVTNIYTGWVLTGSSYKEAIFYGSGGYRTLLIDDNDNFVGLGQPITYYGITDSGFKIDDTTFVVKGTGTSGAFYRKFTVNAYQTDPFVYMGLTDNTASSGSVDITIAGVKDGYTGLTVGANYYLSDAYDGTINVDPTKGTPKIGKAISSTQILMAEI